MLFFILFFAMLRGFAQEAPSYGSQTGISLSAYYFSSQQQIEGYLVPRDIPDPRFIKFRRYLLGHFEQAMPRIQMMLLVRDHLPALIESYVVNNRSELSDRFYRFIMDSAGAQRGAFNDNQVHFEFDSKGRFQVDGIEPNRLGVNTGHGIYFNVDGLNKKETLTVGEAVQLWMHEILHDDAQIRLEERDAWTASFARWIQERTQEFELQKGRKVIAVSVPPVAGRVVSKKDLDPRKSLLVLEMTTKGSEVLRNFYDGFATFGNFLNSFTPSEIRSSTALLMPFIQVSSVRKTSRNSLVVEYAQDSVYYDKSTKSGFFRGGYEGIGWNGNDTPDTDQFRLEWFPETDTTEVSRRYSSKLSSDDFEIYRIQDNGEKRFVSIRVKTQNVLPLMKSKSLHLLARNNGDGKSLSFEVLQRRILNQQEVLLHVQVPQVSMELAQILLMPKSSSEGYSEVSIRPSQPVRLQGTELSHLPIRNIESVTMKERKFEKDRLLIQVQLKTGTKIKGVSFDLEHFMQGYRYTWVGHQMEEELKVDFGMGRKHYVRRTKMKISPKGLLQIEVPFSQMNRFREGPTTQVSLGLGHYVTQSNTVSDVRDNMTRKLAALWIHYEDGRIEKAPTKMLPDEWLSFESTEKIENRARAKAEAEEKYWRERIQSDNDFFSQWGIDDSDDDEIELDIRTCEGLF